ncbi:hypothetical protein AGMMS49974_10070 [Deltaproteobacteria bacterium]|nr:hypothetical protein AGMMS49974_10070 [Deltaproteobacteria bacterium]
MCRSKRLNRHSRQTTASSRRLKVEDKIKTELAVRDYVSLASIDVSKNLELNPELRIYYNEKRYGSKFHICV